jgi:PEP-CTERM motif
VPDDVEYATMTRYLTALVPLVAVAFAPVHAANLVANGDFEAGNTGFFSQYAYSPGGNGTEGQYTVRSNPFPWNGNFVSMADHTSGAGTQMMVVNGSPNVGDVVWRSNVIAISALTNYFFEAYVANVCCAGGGINPPNLTFSVSLNGGPLQALSTLSVPANPVGQWIGLSNSFNTGSSTSAQLFLINANTIRQGNDFAVDDINLDTRSIVNPVPEPATWAMMILGFGAIGAMMRRRSTRVSFGRGAVRQAVG